MKKYLVMTLGLVLPGSLLAQADFKQVLAHKPVTLAQHQQYAKARVEWAGAKVKSLGRVAGAEFLNRFDRSAKGSDYVFAFVCNAGKNDHFVLANKNQAFVFTDFYNHPNHVKFRAAYQKHPNGVWVEYSNPEVKKGQPPRKKYAYIKVLTAYKMCIGSGFSYPS